MYVLLLFFSWCLLVCLCLFLFCFFFKQKTAYEMRISDWSSDVCSSDLIYREGREWRLPNIHGRSTCICLLGPELLSSNVLRFIRTEAIEIGRASCRERVCQYV